MKCLLSILSVSFLVICIRGTSVAENLSTDARKFVHECKDELEIPKDMTIYEMIDKYEDKVACFIGCWLKKIKVMVNGKINVEEVEKTILVSDKKEVREKYIECVNKANKETEECETVSVWLKCLDNDYDLFVKILKSNST